KRAIRVVGAELEGRLVHGPIRRYQRHRANVLVERAIRRLVRVEGEQHGFVRVGDRPAAAAIGGVCDGQAAVHGEGAGGRIEGGGEVVPSVVQVARPGG